jgi:hypothetical protein
MVNRILSFNGLGALTSLDGTVGSGYSSDVERLLDDENREVQNDNSWSVTQRRNVTLTPDTTTKEIVVPAGATVTAVFGESAHLDVVQVGNKLYDQKNNTYQFDDTIKVSVNLLFAPECIPEHIQALVVARAAKRYCEFRRDGQLYQTIEKRERDAYAKARRVDSDIKQPSVEDQPRTMRIRGHYIPLGRRST